MTEAKLILASASPRRRELLAECRCAFTVQSADVNEDVLSGELPADYVGRVAGDKARCIQRQFPAHFVLGCDTAVVLDQRILGKPVDDHQAAVMLQALSGRSHQVFSALVLICPDGLTLSAVSVTEVVFAPLPKAWIERYVASGQGRDKAGAYGIQNEAGLWISRIEGSYSGVVGLPLFETADLLRRAGLISP